MEESKNNKTFNTRDLAVITEAVDKARSYTDEKLKSINWLMAGVVVVCAIGFIQLVIDSAHINSAAYEDYSKRLLENNQVIESNKALVDSNKALQKELEAKNGLLKTLQQQR